MMSALGFIFVGGMIFAFYLANRKEINKTEKKLEKLFD